MEREPLLLTAEDVPSEPQPKPGKQIKITPHMLRVADAAVDISEHPADERDKAFTTRYLVQATLPYRNPKGDPPIWFRTNGNYTLSIQPGYVRRKGESEPQWLGFPYGSIPRLLMFWLTTEALRKGDRKLTLGNSLVEFMTQLGLNPRNGGPGSKRSDRRRLHDQMERLFRAKISFDYADENRQSWLDMQVAPKANLWWDPKVDGQQLTLYESWVELGEEFFKAITEAPVPVDMRALMVLKNSPLALDLYAWSTYKTYQVNQKRKPQRVPWRLLQAQLGTENLDTKDFKKYAKKALRKIVSVYPGLNLDEVDGGLIIHPGLTAVPKKS